MRGQSQNRDAAISAVRLVAFLMILTCHIMEHENMVLAWWFNVGVQIFLCMSGYLYGGRPVEAFGEGFFGRQLYKIMPDYYIVVLFAAFVAFIYAPDQITVPMLLKSLIAYGTIPWGQHLWYIPYILACYLITPSCMKLLHRLEDRSSGVLAATLLGLMAFNLVLSQTYLPYFNSAWINCYLVGLMAGFCRRLGRKGLLRLGGAVLTLLCVGMNSLRIWIIYVSDIHFEGWLSSAFGSFCDYSHLMLGCTLFFGLRGLFSLLFRLKLTPLRWLCEAADVISYDMYLVHHFFILSSFSLVGLLGSLWLDGLLILAVTVAAAVLVHLLSVQVRRLITLP